MGGGITPLQPFLGDSSWAVRTRYARRGLNTDASPSTGTLHDFADGAPSPAGAIPRGARRLRQPDQEDFARDRASLVINRRSSFRLTGRPPGWGRPSHPTTLSGGWD